MSNNKLVEITEITDGLLIILLIFHLKEFTAPFPTVKIILILILHEIA